MAKMLLRTVKLTIDKENYNPIQCKQKDTGRYLLFQILNNGVPFSLQGRTVRASAKKQDGTKIFNDLIIVDATKGMCELQLTSQMLYFSGWLKVEITIYEGKDTLSLIPFTLDIISSIRDDAAVESVNEFSALTIALSKVNEWNAYFEAESGKIEEKYTVRLNLTEEKSEEALDKSIQALAKANDPMATIKSNGSKVGLKQFDDDALAAITGNTTFVSGQGFDVNKGVDYPLKRVVKDSELDTEIDIDIRNSILDFKVLNADLTKYYQIEWIGNGYSGYDENSKYGFIIADYDKDTFATDSGASRRILVNRTDTLYNVPNGITTRVIQSRYDGVEFVITLDYSAFTKDYYALMNSTFKGKTSVFDENTYVTSKYLEIKDEFNKELATIIKESNWYKFTEGIADGSITSIPCILGGMIEDGNVSLTETNFLDTNRWMKYSKNVESSTCYNQVKLDEDFVIKIDSDNKQSKYTDDAYVEFEIIIDSPNAFSTDVRVIGRTSGWTYFRNYSISHKGGRVKYYKKLLIESEFLAGANFSDFKYMATYILARTDKPVDMYVSPIFNNYTKQINKELVSVGANNLETGSVLYEKLSDEVKELISGSSQSLASNRLNKELKVAFAGDSVTWGQGGLNDGYVGELDLLMRTKHINTICADKVIATSTRRLINSLKFYDSQALEISGIGSTLEFNIESDKVYICTAINRENKGASICEIYIDGILYDTFTTYSNKRFGYKTEEFTGNGVDLRFKLSEAFTYNQVVTLNGSQITGDLNKSGSTGDITTGHDYMIVRCVNGNKVVHEILFRNAPTGKIVINYKYGESLTYSKTTIGELSDSLNSGLESYFGDGDLAFDPSKATSISSGLDFRQVDNESFIKYNFASYKKRNIKIKIKELDKRCNASDTPTFIFNFATDTNFKYMNAGIGGFTYDHFNKEDGIINYKKLMEYEPDVIFAMMAANDDWKVATYPVVQDRTVPMDYIEKNSFYWIKNPVKSGSNINIKDVWVDIKSFDEYSITLADSVTVGEVFKNDIININKWGNDERYCQTRLIDTIQGKKITFLTPIDIKKVNLNTKVYIKSIKVYGDNIDKFISNIRKYDNINPKIYLGCPGVPNMNHRQLLGYSEYIRHIAKRNDVEFVDLFTPTSEYQSSVKQEITYDITSTGATEYVILNGTKDIDPILRNVTVEVDGVNIFDGDSVSLCGGYGYYWNSDLKTYGYRTTPTKLLLRNPVQTGKKIIVKGALTRYSSDYCHMGQSSGKYIYGETILNNLI